MTITESHIQILQIAEKAFLKTFSSGYFESAMLVTNASSR